MLILLMRKDWQWYMCTRSMFLGYSAQDIQKCNKILWVEKYRCTNAEANWCNYWGLYINSVCIKNEMSLCSLQVQITKNYIACLNLCFNWSYYSHSVFGSGSGHAAMNGQRGVIYSEQATGGTGLTRYISMYLSIFCLTGPASYLYPTHVGETKVL